MVICNSFLKSTYQATVCQNATELTDWLNSGLILYIVPSHPAHDPNTQNPVPRHLIIFLAKIFNWISSLSLEILYCSFPSHIFPSCSTSAKLVRPPHNGPPRPPSTNTRSVLHEAFPLGFVSTKSFPGPLDFRKI